MFENKCWGILTWLWTYRPQNLIIYVVFDEESDFLGPRTQFLHPDRVLSRKNVPYVCYFCLLVSNELNKHINYIHVLIFYRVIGHDFLEKLGFVEGITSWDLKNRIPRQKLPIWSYSQVPNRPTRSKYLKFDFSVLYYLETLLITTF